MTVDRDARIRALLASAPKADAAMRRRQEVSFAYGNLAIEEPGVTWAMVEAVVSRSKD